MLSSARSHFKIAKLHPNSLRSQFFRPVNHNTRTSLQLLNKMQLNTPKFLSKTSNPSQVLLRQISSSLLSKRAYEDRTTIDPNMTSTNFIHFHKKPAQNRSANPFLIGTIISAILAIVIGFCKPKLCVQRAECKNTNHRHSKLKSLIPVSVQQILEVTGQTKTVYSPGNWKEVYSTEILSNCTKIGEGVFGEVYRTTDEQGNTVILKIVPVLEQDGEEENGPKSQENAAPTTEPMDVDQILSEILISKAINELRTGAQNKTPNFVELKSIKLVNGLFPQILQSKRDEYATNDDHSNSTPTPFRPNQLFLIFEMADGGTDLDSFELDNVAQAIGIVMQVLWTLATAESSLEFEHRDLHTKNILVRCTSSPTVEYSIHGQCYRIPSHGVHVSIVDFTNSRLKLAPHSIMYTDLSNVQDEDDGSAEDKVYMQMKAHNLDDWKAYNLYTNILWINYLIQELIHKLGESGETCKKTCKSLEAMSEALIRCESCTDALYNRRMTETMLTGFIPIWIS